MKAIWLVVAGVSVAPLVSAGQDVFAAEPSEAGSAASASLPKATDAGTAEGGAAARENTIGFVGEGDRDPDRRLA